MTQIQLRRDTSTNFASVNPVLASGEPAFETDTGKFKIGNGTTAYNSLDYIGAGDLPDNITTQGNTFNGANQLVQLDASGKLPAVDGSQLTNISSSTPSNMMTTNTSQNVNGSKTFINCNIDLDARENNTTPTIRARYGGGFRDLINPRGNSGVGPRFGDPFITTQIASTASSGIRVVADQDETATIQTGKVIHTSNMMGCITAGDNISITSTGSGPDRKMIISGTGSSTPSNMVTTDTSQTITESKTFNSSITIGDDILTAQGYRIANGGLGADMLSLGDSNASMALYSNGEIQVTTSSSGANTILHTGNIGSYAATTTQGIKLWKGTQTDYNGITTKDENTLYIITGA